MRVLEELVDELKRSQLALSDAGMGMSVELTIRPVQHHLAYVIVGRWQGRLYESCFFTTSNPRSGAVARMREVIQTWANMVKSAKAS